MTKVVDTFRWRLLVLLVALGLAVPTLPAVANDCEAAPGPAFEPCAAADLTDSCCPAGEDDRNHDEDEDDDRNCCPGGCACACCGCATAAPAMHRPGSAAASIAPPAVAKVDWRTARPPQASAGALLRPPQS